MTLQDEVRAALADGEMPSVDLIGALVERLDEAEALNTKLIQWITEALPVMHGLRRELGKALGIYTPWPNETHSEVPGDLAF